ncbi:MAG: hypothetical protein JW862_11690 [Anaerolineales bacterium]|nr:hypothetical protein [Anaerolineales bacterium]
MMNIPAFIWLIGLLLLAAPLIYFSGRLFPKQERFLPQVLTLIAFAASWFAFVQAVLDFQRNGTSDYMIGTVALQMDGLALLLAGVGLLLGTLVTLYSWAYMAPEDEGVEKFFAMLAAMVAVIIGLGCATDIFNLWMWFEAMAVTSYLLVAFYRNQPHSLEAGLKYLVQSAVGSMLVLLGISMLFAQTGTVVIAEIKTAVVPQMVLLGAAVLLVVGFGVKSALVPMHTWLPDAHSQAPSGISAMLSGVVIEAGLVAMLRSLSAVAGVSQSWALLLLGFAAINMLVGNLMALRQTQVKRLLAYSSLAHMGYILLGIGIAVYSGQVNGAEGSLFHLFNHGVMKGLAFLSAGALLYTLHVVSGSHAPLTVTDLNGAARKYPLLGITFSLALLGLGGIPPLAGFLSKWQIFLAGFETGSLGIELLVVFAALNSVLSLAYYAPLINAMYRLKPSDSVQAGKSVPFSMSLPLVLLAAATVVVGFWPGLLHWLTAPAGNALLQILGK